MNDEARAIHPFWRAVVGAAFGLAIGVVCVTKGFWLALVVAVLVVFGGILGVLLIRGD
jgi:hypothetical protein